MLISYTSYFFNKFGILVANCKYWLKIIAILLCADRSLPVSEGEPRNTKYVIYIAIVVVLLIAWYYSASIYYSISPKVKSAKMASPYVDDRIESQIKQTMGR